MRVAQGPQRRAAEKRRVEGGPAIARIPIEFQRSRRELRLVQILIVYAVWICPQQRIVVIVVERHGQTGAESCSAGNEPAFGPPVCAAKQLLERDLVSARGEMKLCSR